MWTEIDLSRQLRDDELRQVLGSVFQIAPGHVHVTGDIAAEARRLSDVADRVRRDRA
jgi:hypothetical protein